MKNSVKKIVSILLCIVLTAAICPISFAYYNCSEEHRAYLDSLAENFKFNEGVETNGFSVDYMSYSPKAKSGKKYPLVVWFHGMGDGSEPGVQFKSDIQMWSSKEMQSRFTNGGAYILVMRSLEEKSKFWSNDLIEPAMASVLDFIKKNPNVDTTRIYVGGYSMGGKMTFKMLISYPDFFAAGFPICPAYTPSKAEFELIKNIPIWLFGAKADPLVAYRTNLKPDWKYITQTNERLDDCRFTLFTHVTNPDGSKTESDHHSWYPVVYDMFDHNNKCTYLCKTVDGNGNELELKYPDGVISWLCKFKSQNKGAAPESSGAFDCKIDKMGVGCMFARYNGFVFGPVVSVTVFIVNIVLTLFVKD